MLVYDDTDHDNHLDLNEFYAAFSKLYSEYLHSTICCCSVKFNRNWKDNWPCSRSFHSTTYWMKIDMFKKNESFLIYCSQLLILIFILMLLLLLLLVHSALSLEWICLDLSKKEPTWAEGGRMFHCWRWNFKPISHWKLNNRSVSTWSSDWEWKPLSVGSNQHWKEFVKRWFNRLEDKKGGK